MWSDVLNFFSYAFIICGTFIAAVEGTVYFFSLFVSRSKEKPHSTELLFPLVFFVGAAAMRYFAAS